MVAKSNMTEAITRAERAGSKVALLFIDVDNFKRVNDSLGHTVGDELLPALGKRLSDSMRENDALSRVSDDEFLVIAPRIHELAAAEVIAERLRRALSFPLYLCGMDISSTISIDAAVYPNKGRYSKTRRDLTRSL